MKPVLIICGVSLLAVASIISMLYLQDEEKDFERLTEFETIHEINERINAGEIKPTKSGGIDQSTKWCLDLFDEEGKESLGYFKGDFLDELVCRQDIQNMIGELEDVTLEEVQAFFGK